MATGVIHDTLLNSGLQVAAILRRGYKRIPRFIAQQWSTVGLLWLFEDVVTGLFHATVHDAIAADDTCKLSSECPCNMILRRESANPCNEQVICRDAGNLSVSCDNCGQPHHSDSPVITTMVSALSMHGLISSRSRISVVRPRAR
ncbi:hypothetical protein J6590_012132 [Homalodisca vitripennis]|nr:hypothetical protein J6590_012132 [Homalodisca vitripennis]